MPDLEHKKRRPPWWPETEAWPPRDGRPPLRFMLRAVFGLLLMMTIIALLCGGALWGVYVVLESRQAAGPFWRWPPAAIDGRAAPRFFPFAFCGWALLLAFGVLIVTRAVRRTILPINDVMRAAERVEAGDYSVRVRQRGGGDARRLARAFNAMTDRLARNEEQRKRLLADVTHELRTPLTIIQGNIEGMLDGVYPRDDARLTVAFEETRVMARLIDDLRTLSLAEAGTLKLRRESVDLAALIGDTLAAFETQAREKNVSLRNESAADLPLIEIDPTRIREVLTNLIANALRHTPAGGKVRVSATRADNVLVISVIDTGPGIPADALEHVFDRFYKTSDSGGTGLGLAIARNLIEAHGGRISAHNAPGGGAEMRAKLPV